MNPVNRPPIEPELFCIEELEARFEMQALPLPALTPGLDWKCGCTFES